jgi:hypothetical protein
MAITRNDGERGTAGSQAKRRTLSEQAAQAWSVVITIALFSGFAAALNVLFGRMGGG